MKKTTGAVYSKTDTNAPLVGECVFCGEYVSVQPKDKGAAAAGSVMCMVEFAGETRDQLIQTRPGNKFIFIHDICLRPKEAKH